MSIIDGRFDQYLEEFNSAEDKIQLIGLFDVEAHNSFHREYEEIRKNVMSIERKHSRRND